MAQKSNSGGLPMTTETHMIHSHIRQIARLWLGPNQDLDPLCDHIARALMSYSFCKPMKKATLVRENQP